MKMKVSDLVDRKVRSPYRAGLIKKAVIKAAVAKAKKNREAKMEMAWKGFWQESIDYIKPVGTWGWVKFWFRYPIALYKFKRVS